MNSDVNAEIDWLGHRLGVDFGQGRSIAIPLDPHGRQPAFFTTRPATAAPLRGGDFVGSVSLGGSCNAEVVELAPHCHGTHTECRGHLLREPIPVQECIYSGPSLARLISLEPANDASGQPVYTAELLAPFLGGQQGPVPEALVIRSLPNDPGKLCRDYGEQTEYAVPDSQAMALLASSRLRHLLLDSPSLDPAHDGGRLANHRTWWGIDTSLAPAGLDAGRRSLTEMIYAPNELADGLYWLHLELSPLVGDATPSRPLLYPVELLA